VNFKGDTASLARFASNLRELPRLLGNRVATLAAPALTTVARRTADASENAFGAAWPLGADGQKVTLRKSGTMLRSLTYVAIGQKLRVALTTRYAKYQIGKRPVFPTQGGALPRSYIAALDRVTQEALEGEVLT